MTKRVNKLVGQGYNDHMGYKTAVLLEEKIDETGKALKKLYDDLDNYDKLNKLEKQMITNEFYLYSVDSLEQILQAIKDKELFVVENEENLDLFENLSELMKNVNDELGFPYPVKISSKNEKVNELKKFYEDNTSKLINLLKINATDEKHLNSSNVSFVRTINDLLEQYKQIFTIVKKYRYLDDLNHDLLKKLNDLKIDIGDPEKPSEEEIDLSEEEEKPEKPYEPSETSETSDFPEKLREPRKKRPRAKRPEDKDVILEIPKDMTKKEAISKLLELYSSKSPEDVEKVKLSLEALPKADLLAILKEYKIKVKDIIDFPQAKLDDTSRALLELELEQRKMDNIEKLKTLTQKKIYPISDEIFQKIPKKLKKIKKPKESDGIKNVLEAEIERYDLLGKGCDPQFASDYVKGKPKKEKRLYAGNNPYIEFGKQYRKEHSAELEKLFPRENYASPLKRNSEIVKYIASIYNDRKNNSL